MTEAANMDIRRRKVSDRRISIDDRVLVRQCRDGDSVAMERLILRYQNRIYNVILKMCGDPDDAAELTQETFVKVIENIDKFEGRSGFYTWTFRIAVNLTLNFCQKNAKLNLRSLDSETEQYSDQNRQVLSDFLSDENSPDPVSVAQDKELYEIAWKALMGLDDAHRAVIVLRDIEGMNYSQISKVLDVELGTVRSRLSRARSKLTQIMEAIVK